MRLIHLDDVAVALPGRILLERVAWSVFRGERYGLVGANGSGKTTLMRLMVGESEPSHGAISRARDLTIGYLPQEGVAQKERELFVEAWNGLPDLPTLEKEIALLREYVASEPHDSDSLERLGVLQHRWEDLEGYRAEAKVSGVLFGLGFKESDFKRPANEFSGGWQMRIALAKLLLHDPDLLLLDEPTNHLDLPALIWLEGFLSGFDGALIMVSHDRGFLDRVIKRTAELDRGKLTLYQGNYSEYEEQRQERAMQREAEAARTDEERKRIEAFIERFRYKASKARQVQSRVKQLEKMEVPEWQPSGQKRVRFHFPPAPSSGRVVFEMQDVAKRYDSIEVFKDINLILTRGEKVALVGINGAGKSTLCRLIVGAESPSSGTANPGHNVSVDFFAQDADFHLNSQLTILEQLEAEAGGASQAWLRSLLGAFLFSGDDVFKKISVLSGGEKSRLALAKMLLHPSNFIILDEPTNHLDMASQAVLLEALKAYEGTLLVVSHDRFFLDQLVDRVLELENGTLHDWPGNLSDYLARKGFGAGSAIEPGSIRERIPVADSRETGYKTREQKRIEAQIRNRNSSLLRDVRHEVKDLQSQIDIAETRKREIEMQLAEESLYKDGEKCRQLLSEYDRIRSELPAMLTAWESAASRLDDLERKLREELEGSG
ncbi:ABC transporter ATP-binding protein [candidate division KSB1 bacterium]|nr:MAG: ABC transporter ATP-binding protein [candidate division KSB1 bacterium]